MVVCNSVAWFLEFFADVMLNYCLFVASYGGWFIVVAVCVVGLVIVLECCCLLWCLFDSYLC